jgi:hypothetical protein
VARKLSRRAGGTIGATGLYVVAIAGLHGPFRAIAARLPKDLPALPTAVSDGSVACAPLAGVNGAPQLLASASDSGLPAGVVLNAERASLASEDSGSVEVRIFADADADLPANRFLCATGRGPAATDRLPEAGRNRWPIPKSAGLLTEEDYLAAVARQVPTERPAGHGVIPTAVQIVTIANHPSARGIEGRIGGDPSSPPDLAIVARDLVMDGERVRATEFYITPWPDELIQTVAIRDMFLDLGEPFPTFDMRGSLCGPVTLPHHTPVCPPGFCGGGGEGGVAWNPTQGAYGTDRFAIGGNRTTLHWPTSFGTLEAKIAVIACTLFEPPHRDPPPMRCDIDVFTGKLIAEECNGRDDNCNGQIDEGFACSYVESCPCQPRSCGATTCGSLPDGCGQVITCGAPCP